MQRYRKAVLLMSCPKQYVAWVVLCLSIIKITIRQCAVGRKESINLSTICLYWYNGHSVAVFNIVQTFSGEQTQGHDCRRGSTVIIYYSSETITIHPRRNGGLVMVLIIMVGCFPTRIVPILQGPITTTTVLLLGL